MAEICSQLLTFSKCLFEIFYDECPRFAFWFILSFWSWKPECFSLSPHDTPRKQCITKICTCMCYITSCLHLHLQELRFLQPLIHANLKNCTRDIVSHNLRQLYKIYIWWQTFFFLGLILFKLSKNTQVWKLALLWSTFSYAIYAPSILHIASGGVRVVPGLWLLSTLVVCVGGGWILPERVVQVTRTTPSVCCSNTCDFTSVQSYVS